MRAFTLVALLSLAVSGAALADSSDSLRVGDKAPDFTLPFATKDSVWTTPLTLSSLIGQRNVVIAFYPADWSGGCTKEVCSFRDNFSSLSSLNADVVGISGDYQFSHYEWAKYHNLPFRLASDHKHTVAKAYGVYNEPVGFNNRTVFVVDKTGKLSYIDWHYSPRDSVSLMKLRGALASMH
jgi:peroxiredoxin Q/BCP